MSTKFTDDQLLEMFGPLMLDSLEPLLLKEHELWVKIDTGEMDYRRPMDDRDFRFAVIAYRQKVNQAVRGEMYSWVKTWFPRMLLTNFGPESHFAKKYGDVNWVSKAMFIAMPQEYDWTDAVRTLGEFINEPVFSVTKMFVEQKVYPRAKAEYERRFKDEPEELERYENESITAFIRRQKEHRQKVRQDPNWRLKRDVEGALEMVESRLFPKARPVEGSGEPESGLTPMEQLRRKVAELTQRITELRVEEKDFAGRSDYMNAQAKAQEAGKLENIELPSIRKELEELERAEEAQKRAEVAAAQDIVRPPAPGEAQPMIKIGEAVHLPEPPVLTGDPIAELEFIADEVEDPALAEAIGELVEAAKAAAGKGKGAKQIVFALADAKAGKVDAIRARANVLAALAR